MVKEKISKNEQRRLEKEKENKKKMMIRGGIGIVLLASVLFYFLIVIGGDDDFDDKNLVYGDDVIEMQYFHWTRCPHCIKQNEFNLKLLEKYPNLKINRFEITEPNTMEIYKMWAEKTEGLDPEKFPGTPLTIINGQINTGYGTDETTGLKLIEMIEQAQADIDANWDSSSMTRTSELRVE